MALLLHVINQQRQQRQEFTRRLFRDRSNPLDFMNDQQIVKNYRLDRPTIFGLCEELKDVLEKPTRRSQSLSASLQVMVALRYYASGSYLNVIGDAHGVSKMTVSRCVNIISKALADRTQTYVKFPMSVEERQVVMYDFYDIKEFPLVLGAVDGTLIPIKAPSVDEHPYVCRKGYHALNIQCVCNAQNQFLNIVARWPGSTHDAHIWNNCNLSMAFENRQISNGWLLGDSAYGLKPWLLTPVLSPSTAEERKYNTAHRSTRSTIERTYGIWKMRLRCLYRGLTLSPARSINVILATACLHNKCVERRIPIPDDEVDIGEHADDGGNEGHPDSNDGRRVRDQLISSVFGDA